MEGAKGEWPPKKDEVINENKHGRALRKPSLVRADLFRAKARGDTPPLPA